MAVRCTVEQVQAGATARLVQRLQEAVSASTTDSVAWREIPVQRPSASQEPLIRLEVEPRRVFLRGGLVELTRIEFELLLFLCTHPGTVHDREDLMERVWHLRKIGAGRTVDVHIRRLRSKFDPVAFPVTTVRGIGYRFDGADRVSVESALDTSADVPVIVPAAR